MRHTVAITDENGEPVFVGTTDKLIIQRTLNRPAIVALVAEELVVAAPQTPVVRSVPDGN